MLNQSRLYQQQVFFVRNLGYVKSGHGILLIFHEDHPIFHEDPPIFHEAQPSGIWGGPSGI